MQLAYEIHVYGHRYAGLTNNALNIVNYLLLNAIPEQWNGHILYRIHSIIYLDALLSVKYKLSMGYYIHT